MKKQAFVPSLVNGLIITLLILIIACSNRIQNTEVQTGNSEENNWKIVGPGAGGGVFIPTVSPFDTSFVFSKGDMTGAFVSYNGGKNWNQFNLMSLVKDFEFDPVEPDVVYAASRGYLYEEDRGSGLTLLYKSEKRGKTWNVIYPDISKIAPLEKLQSMSFLPSELVNDMPDGSIDLIKVDPANTNRIFLGLSPLRPYIENFPEGTPHFTFLVGTENKGNDWKLIAKIPGTEVFGMFPHCQGADGDEITVITNDACAKVNRNTGEIIQLSKPDGRIIGAQSGIANGKTILYIIIEVFKNENGILKGGIFRSDNGGETWAEINTDILEKIQGKRFPVFRALGVCENQPEVVYFSVVTHAPGPDAKVNNRYEIYRTGNSGQSWTAVYSANDIEVLSKNFDDSWLNQKYGPGWGGDVLTLGVAPTNPDICYATDFGQMFKTSNGGKTWSQVCSTNNPDGSVTTTGLDLTCCYGVIFDPFDKNHLIVSYIDIGLFHSYDGGISWKQSSSGIPDNWVNTCYHVTFDPAVKGKVWSTWANKHSLPRKSQFGDGMFRGYSGGVAYSEDGGKNWLKYTNGLPENCIATDLLLDPSSPENSRTLYLSTFNQGIFKSVDGGKSWVSANNGLKENRYGWQIRFAGERIFLLCVRGYQGEKSIDAKLYYSDDKAENWNEAVLPEGVTGLTDFLVDPKDEKHIYLSCWPKHENDADVCGGIYETKDGGKNWVQCFDERIRVSAAAFDPTDSKIIYITTFQNAAYRSSDSGKNWSRIPGYRFKWGQCPIPDPHNPGKLYLTTYGLSVYYGSDQGSAEEFGKIENIPESWW
ncbi:MAG: hypothetical protein IPF54_01395 [Draconibacterium sp.]|nr:hypothetical protein [Draconibacterium sp.]